MLTNRRWLAAWCVLSVAGMIGVAGLGLGLGHALKHLIGW